MTISPRKKQLDEKYKHAPFTHHTKHPKNWFWRFWIALPLYPYSQRKTVCHEIVENTIWTFDQLQGILYTVVPIRMTIVRLETGGLLVYAPVAPTNECIGLVNELVVEYGDVKYIILPTSSGLEHKVFAGPFARFFPHAQVFVAPNQWSFPVNLPLHWLGFPKERTQSLPEDPQKVPFYNEFDYAVLDIDLGRGSFAEVALCHRASRTLLLTDSLLSIPTEPPAIAQLDPYPLLFHARESALEPIEDTPANRQKGWQRIALFAVYFRPSALKPVELKRAFQEMVKAPDRSRKAYFGLYPFQWQDNWQQSFEALRKAGRSFVAPILRTLILPQAPQQVIDWANQVASWEFNQMISCHFDAPVRITPQQFRQAFAFLEKEPGLSLEEMAAIVLPEADCKYIEDLELALTRRGIATTRKDKV